MQPQASKQPDPVKAIFVIRHGVSMSSQHLFGQIPNFPANAECLSPSLIIQIQAGLVARGVQKFDDQMFHGEAHPLAMYDLVRHISVADAIQEGFEVLNVKAGEKLITHQGIRWSVSSRYTECRIFGPSSDPSNSANVVIIDLTKPVDPTSETQVTP